MATNRDGLEVLYKISDIINTTQDREKVLKAVMKEVVRLTGATSGSIAMLDARRGVLDIETAINIPVKTWKRLKLQLGVGVTGWAAYKGESVRVDDVRRESRYVRLKTDIRSELAVPMFIHGKVIGVINVDSTRKAAFSEEDERLLQAVAGQSAKVIETARLYERLKRYAGQMESLFEAGRQLASPAPIDRVLNRVAQEGRALLDANACVFVELSDDGGSMMIRGQDGGNAAWLDSPAMRTGDSLLAPVVGNRQALVIEDLRDRRPFWGGELEEGIEYRSLFAVPVLYQEMLVGVLAVLNEVNRSYSDEERSLLSLLANQTALAILSMRRQDRIMAMEDNLHRAERFSLLGTLAAEIAHEIRNPITIINLLLDSALEEVDTEAQASSDLRIVREKVGRIERIVDQTLLMGRHPEPDLQPVSVNAVVSDVLLFMNYKFIKSGIEVKLQLDELLPDLPLDRGQMQQVLLNLIVNASEAMDSSGKITITSSSQWDEDFGESVLISIQDNGCGMTREELEGLFVPFYTTRSRGTGLGLFISRKIVMAHGGDIRVQAKEGKGSTFTVILPVGKSSDAAAEPATIDLIESNNNGKEV